VYILATGFQWIKIVRKPQSLSGKSRGGGCLFTLKRVTRRNEWCGVRGGRWVWLSSQCRRRGTGSSAASCLGTWTLWTCRRRRPAAAAIGGRAAPTGHGRGSWRTARTLHPRIAALHTPASATAHQRHHRFLVFYPVINRCGRPLR